VVKQVAACQWHQVVAFVSLTLCWWNIVLCVQSGFSHVHREFNMWMDGWTDGRTDIEASYRFYRARYIYMYRIHKEPGNSVGI